MPGMSEIAERLKNKVAGEEKQPEKIPLLIEFLSGFYLCALCVFTGFFLYRVLGFEYARSNSVPCWIHLKKITWLVITLELPRITKH